MKIDVRNSCENFNSYRAARVKSLFNAESGANFSISAELPVDDPAWSLGLIVGPSGSGKTSIGRMFWGEESVDSFGGWPFDRPIIDAISPDGDFNDVTAALASVGLGDVPSWLRPYHVLSNGEKFRANLARVICDAPKRVVIDEFTSVVDRQIAKFGALAFAKSWKRLSKTGGNQCVLLSCHYDIIEWLEPDWVFDTATGKYAGRSLWRRPRFELEIWQTDGSYWNMFEPHHYMSGHLVSSAKCFAAYIDGRPVAFTSYRHFPHARVRDIKIGHRLVVLPDYQGLGIATVLENWLGEHLTARGYRYRNVVAHPGMIRLYSRSPRWQATNTVGGVRTSNSKVKNLLPKLPSNIRRLPRSKRISFGPKLFSNLST